MVTLPEVLSACPQDLDTKLTVQMNDVSSFFFALFFQCFRKDFGTLLFTNSREI